MEPRLTRNVGDNFVFFNWSILEDGTDRLTRNVSDNFVFFKCSTLEDETDRLIRNVDDYQPTLHDIPEQRRPQHTSAEA